MREERGRRYILELHVDPAELVQSRGFFVLNARGNRKSMEVIGHLHAGHVHVRKARETSDAGEFITDWIII